MFLKYPTFSSAETEAMKQPSLVGNEVGTVESCSWSNEKNLIVDRFAAAYFLFALFFRSRGSDLRCVYGYIADILEVEGQITGYLETQDSSPQDCAVGPDAGPFHATSSPVWGVGKTPCVLEFVKVAKLADGPLGVLHNIPLLPAPTEDVQWINRSTSTLEAKRWPLSVLSRRPFPGRHHPQV